MRKNTYLPLLNLDVRSAEDWDTLALRLKSIISEQGRDGEEPAIIMQYHYAQNTIGVKLAYMD